MCNRVKRYVDGYSSKMKDPLNLIKFDLTKNEEKRRKQTNIKQKKFSQILFSHYRSISCALCISYICMYIIHILYDGSTVNGTWK